MATDVDVSNAIGGKFKAKNGEPVCKWGFEFKQSSKEASMNVYLNGVGAVVMDLCESQLTCDLNKKDINQLIQWLYSVKCQLPNS